MYQNGTPLQVLTPKNKQQLGLNLLTHHRIVSKSHFDGNFTKMFSSDLLKMGTWSVWLFWIFVVAVQDVVVCKVTLVLLILSMQS